MPHVMGSNLAIFTATHVMVAGYIFKLSVLQIGRGLVVYLCFLKGATHQILDKMGTLFQKYYSKI